MTRKLFQKIISDFDFWDMGISRKEFRFRCLVHVTHYLLNYCTLLLLNPLDYSNSKLVTIYIFYESKSNRNFIIFELGEISHYSNRITSVVRIIRNTEMPAVLRIRINYPLNLQMLCNNLQINVFDQRAGQLLHYETLKQDINEKFQMNEDSICLCLHTLHCQRRIGLEYKMENNEKQIHLIKIPSKPILNIKYIKMLSQYILR